MEAVLMSVPHTGTNYTRRFFREKGWDAVALNDRPNPRRPTLYSAHIMKQTQIGPALKLAERMPLVCPMRHPYWVEESWKRRGKDIGLLIRCFHEMAEHFGHAHYFIVDSPDREGELQRLSGHIGVQFKPDWTVVGSKQHTHDLPRDEISPSQDIERLVSDLASFLSRFYSQP